MAAQAPGSELTEWVKLYTKDLLSWAVHRISDRETAEDLVQETFLVAAEKSHSFDRRSQPKTWLFGILNNKIAEHYRARYRHGRQISGTEETLAAFFDADQHWTESAWPGEWSAESGHLLDNEDFVKILERCLGQLPEHWHACVTLKYLENRPPSDICQDLGISTTNYWQILHRAKLKLRDCLEHHWFKKE